MKTVLSGSKIKIFFTYDVATINMVRRLPSRSFNKFEKCWEIPVEGAYQSVSILENFGFLVGQNIHKAVEDDKKRAEAIEKLTERSDVDFKSSLPLYNYQKVGAKFMVDSGSALLGDDIGTGKTRQSLAAVVKLGKEPVLILCPSILKYHWALEIEHLIGSSFVVIEGTPQKRKTQWNTPVRFYIANYELLLRDFDSMDRQWGCIIGDEITKISNPRAKQSKLIKKLSASHKFGLTGTLISNRADDVWNVVDWIRPGVLGSYFQFMQRYCVQNQWGGIGDYQNMDELRKKLKRYMIRRLKVDVLTELPDLIVSDVPFVLNKEERGLYDKIRKELLLELQEAEISKVDSVVSIQNTLVKMLRLRQLTDSMELLGESKTSTKLEVLKGLLVEILTDGRKCIVFTQFSKMADILERELGLYNPLKITGNVKKREQVIDKFNKMPTNRVLIMTSAGQWGLNIQAASVIFHYDLEWSLAKMTQREGRAYRLGQKRNVLVYNLLAVNTLEGYTKKVIEKKSEISSAVLGDGKISIQQIKEALNYKG